MNVNKDNTFSTVLNLTKFKQLKKKSWIIVQLSI